MITVTGCILRFGALDTSFEVVEPSSDIELQTVVPIVFENGKREEPIVGYADLIRMPHGIDAKMHFVSSEGDFEGIKKMKPSVRGRTLEKTDLPLLGVSDGIYIKSKVQVLSKIMINGIAMCMENQDHGIMSIEGMINDSKK